MDGGRDILKNAYRKAAIAAISLMCSVLIYVLVAEALHNLVPPWKGIAFTPDHPYYDYVRYGLLALGLVGILLATQISTAVNLSPKKLTDPAPALITHSVIVSSACDIIGLFGLLLFLMAGNITDIYIFGGLSLGLSVVFFPRYGRWEELAQPWIGSPAAQLDEQKTSVKATNWKATIIILGASAFMLVSVFFCRDNALKEEYSFLLWYIFLPLTVIVLLYFFCVFTPRSAKEKGRQLDCRPGLWYPAGILGSFLFAGLLTLGLRGTLRTSMDEFNHIPIQVESVVLGIYPSNHCRMRLDLTHNCSICLQYRGHRPVQTPWPLEQMTAEKILKLSGQKVVLVGRKSFAGTVIDEIRLPSDR
jgi:hypothetical protein